jgi:PAS domain S-box-containing protein
MPARTLRALLESEQRFRLTFDHAPIGMALVDRALRFMRVNDALCAMLGYAPEQLVGRSFVDVTHPEDVEEDVGLAERLFSGEIPSYELDKRYLTASGEVVWIHLIGNVIRDEDGLPLYGLAIVENVTERRRAEAERRALAERTEQVRRLESLGVLTGGIAHDFNNLLVGILGEADLVLDELGPDEPIRGPLERIHETARRASDLCQQMLAYGGRVRAEVAPLDLRAAVGDALRLLQTSFPEGVRLEAALSKDGPVVDADRTFLRRILSNLVSNARQAVADGGRVTVRTFRARRAGLAEGAPWLGELPAGAHVGVLEIEDDGVGMDPDTRERIFEPFFSTRGPGRGLGLASTIGLIRSLRGAVRVESEPDRGTRIQVALPLAAEAAASAPAPARPGPDGSILVVDDDPAVRRILAAMLGRLGFHAVGAASGEEALHQLGDRDFRAILLDVEMPGLAGEALARALADAAPGTPLVALSGYDEPTARARLGDAETVGFLQKPFTRSGLETALRRALRD